MDSQAVEIKKAAHLDSPKHVGEVTEQVSSLLYAVNDLFDNIDLLDDRLRLILRQEPATMAEKTETLPSFNTELGEGLYELVAKIRRANGRISNIRERVEL